MAAPEQRTGPATDSTASEPASTSSSPTRSSTILSSLNTASPEPGDRRDSEQTPDKSAKVLLENLPDEDDHLPTVPTLPHFSATSEGLTSKGGTSGSKRFSEVPTTFPPDVQAEQPVASTSSTFLTSTRSIGPSSRTSSSASPAGAGMRRTPSSQGATVGAKVWGVCLVGFDHTLGPNIEFTYPEDLRDNSELQKHLPFLALPDGAHARDEDYSYFHLLLPSVAPFQTIFGISCNRQIPADQLLNKGKEVTRSTVQKAIVVLASKPIFGALRDKLGVVTRSFFAQRDFNDKSILVDLFKSFDPAHLDAAQKGKGREQERDVKDGETPAVPSSPTAAERAAEETGGMYMGTSLRELVHRFRFKTLMLLKLLVLQRRVMFYAAHTPVEQLCTFQYSLVTLIPALLTNLQDSASPVLDERVKRLTKPSSLRTSDKYSLIKYLGLPLNVFGKGSFFQPYLPLQQIDLLKTKSYLVGTTNSIFQQQRDCFIDVVVNIDSATLDVLNPKLTPLITLTAADRKWMDEIVTLVDQSWNGADPSRPTSQGFVGSDDFIRAKFEEYVCSLLACVKFGEFLAEERGERAEMLLSAPELESYNPASFNEAFLNAFKRTTAFELWDRTTDEVIFDLVEPKHPMEGKTNPIEDVGIRLVHGLHDSLGDVTLPNFSQLPANLQNLNLAPLPMKARERLSKGWSSGMQAMEAFREDWAKRAAAAEQEGEKSAPGEGATGTLDPLATSAQPPPSPGVGQTFFAGVDVAKSGAATLATGLGSFLGAATRKASLFGGPTSSAAGSTEVSAAPSTRTRVHPSDPPPPSSPKPPMSATQTPASLASFLRPLSTAAAATVPTSPERPREQKLTPAPSTSTVDPSPSQIARTGFSGFFGGLRRTLSPLPSPALSASSTPGTGTPSTGGVSGFGTPPATSFLSAGGWGGTAIPSIPSTPGGSVSSLPSPALRARDIAGDLGADDGSDSEHGNDDGTERHDQAEAEANQAQREREKARRKLEGLAADSP
ncbi:late secretory pathway protein AVL9 family protein [Rhodotorula toruloides]|uniref:Late secretory pathway protein AVL9 family protein n=1 Tax=Rhodotorula toruloides TaxID=5286 RepID=A0A511KJ92_RHOTO|nr:late secretory pathway protein AVL9 family protein [Rhodotorula toruloides]